jgi:homoserine kinase type II
MAVNAADLLDSWELPGPAVAEPASHGTNNATWLVRTTQGSYVLRLYQNTADPARVAYEHELLLRLSRVPLPFAVPVPVAARSGRTLVPVVSGARHVPAATSGPAAGAALAALFPRIPGAQPPRTAATAALCGATLAELDGALSQISNLEEPSTPTHGDVERIHPQVPDPLTLPESLALSAGAAAHLSRLMAVAVDQAPGLYRHLPRQIIHSDFGPGNTLVANGRITGVLDFEFAAPDLRAMDVAVGLLHTAILGAPLSQVWGVLESFARAYGQRLPLSSPEVHALPALIRLRLVVSVVHRAGRWRQGLAADSAVLDRVTWALETDSWLSANGDRLVDMALAWIGGRTR